MAGKLEENGLWESSRMIIPQHRDAAVMQEKESKKRRRPELDEQEWELIAQVLYESRAYTLPCTVTIFEVYEDRQVTGVVERIDTAGDRLLLDISAGEARDIERIKLSDVLKAERS